MNPSDFSANVTYVESCINEFWISICVEQGPAFDVCYVYIHFGAYSQRVLRFALDLWLIWVSPSAFCVCPTTTTTAYKMIYWRRLLVLYSHVLHAQSLTRFSVSVFSCLVWMVDQDTSEQKHGDREQSHAVAIIVQNLASSTQHYHTKKTTRAFAKKKTHTRYNCVWIIIRCNCILQCESVIKCIGWKVLKMDDKWIEVPTVKRFLTKLAFLDFLSSESWQNWWS